MPPRACRVHPFHRAQSREMAVFWLARRLLTRAHMRSIGFFAACLVGMTALCACSSSGDEGASGDSSSTDDLRGIPDDFTPDTPSSKGSGTALDEVRGDYEAASTVYNEAQFKKLSLARGGSYTASLPADAETGGWMATKLSASSFTLTLTATSGSPRIYTLQKLSATKYKLLGGGGVSQELKKK